MSISPSEAAVDLTSRRLVVAHNPHSSRSRLVENYVFSRLNQAGYNFATIEVKQASLDDNVKSLKRQIKSGDVIICAAGDGSAHAVAHSVMAAGKKNVSLGFLAFGNFNDLPKTFNTKKAAQDPVEFLKSATEQTIIPLEVSINGKQLRSALLYTTIGWTARAASQFDKPKRRQKSVKGQTGVINSLWHLGWYYLKSRHHSKLATFELDNKEYNKTTDVLCMNGPSLARMFKVGSSHLDSDKFLYRLLDVRSLVKNIPFLTKGVFSRIEGVEAKKLDLKFQARQSVDIQCDGEVIKPENVNKITVSKSKIKLQVLTNL